MKEENNTATARSEHPLQSLMESVARASGFTAEQITGRSRTADLSHVRQIFCWTAHCEGYSAKTIGEQINRDYTTVARSIAVIYNFISINDKKTLHIIELLRPQSCQFPNPENLDSDKKWKQT
jgi:chromosomal replication initiation ATPase DnaA